MQGCVFKHTPRVSTEVAGRYLKRVLSAPTERLGWVHLRFLPEEIPHQQTRSLHCAPIAPQHIGCSGTKECFQNNHYSRADDPGFTANGQSRMVVIVHVEYLSFMHKTQEAKFKESHFTDVSLRLTEVEPPFLQEQS